MVDLSASERRAAWAALRMIRDPMEESDRGGHEGVGRLEAATSHWSVLSGR